MKLERRGDRVAEGARLEIVCRGNSTVGSNPTLSAKCSLHSQMAPREGFGGRSPDFVRRAWSESLSCAIDLFCNGEVPEWSNGAVSKTVDRASGPWVRIPPSPPLLPL